MASNSDHMEYSTWRIFGVLWSASGSTPFDYIYCHMEYSIRSLFTALWSTPYGHCGVHIFTWLMVHTLFKLILNFPYHTELVSQPAKQFKAIFLGLLNLWGKNIIFPPSSKIPQKNICCTLLLAVLVNILQPKV